MINTHKKDTPKRTVSGQTRAHTRKKAQKVWSIFKLSVATLIAATFAFLFLMPIILTITNSFMAASEISANYGSVFATTDTGGKEI